MTFQLKRKLRVLVLVHEDLIPPDSVDDLTDEQMQPFKTEFDVTATLSGMGHTIEVAGVYSDLRVIREVIERFKPHVVFNLLEEFHGQPLFDQHVVSYLELMRQSYTGCNPRGLTLAHDKALSKKILAYHRLHVPRFAVFPRGRKIRRPARVTFPLLVKSAIEEGSVGISQASIVYDDNKLAERVRMVHEKIETDAIAEQYIEGRELYVAVVGNNRLQTFPPLELTFKNLPEGAPNIATDKVKWDYSYQKKVGLETRPMRKDSPQLLRHIDRTAKRIYRTLGLSGYARLDFRLTCDNELYLLEANPNPQLSYGDDFAESAELDGVDYEMLLQKIINLGLIYRPIG